MDVSKRQTGPVDAQVRDESSLFNAKSRRQFNTGEAGLIISDRTRHNLRSLWWRAVILAEFIHPPGEIKDLRAHGRVLAVNHTSIVSTPAWNVCGKERPDKVAKHHRSLMGEHHAIIPRSDVISPQVKLGKQH